MSFWTFAKSVAIEKQLLLPDEAFRTVRPLLDRERCLVGGGLLVMSGLVPPLVPAIFMGFELFVGIVQALIFAILTLAFLSLASTSHSEAEHGAAH